MLATNQRVLTVRRQLRHHPDLLREGDEAWVVLVDAEERIDLQLRHPGVARGPGMFEPLEHFFRLLPQSIDRGDLDTRVFGVLVDQFFQGHIRFRVVTVGEVGERQSVGAPERIGLLFGQFQRGAGFAAQDLNDRQPQVVLGGLRLQLDRLVQRCLGLIVAAERAENEGREGAGSRLNI